MRLQGRVAVITGAASGFGLATAERFAQEAADVVVADINEAGLQAAAERIEATGRRSHAVHCDVTQRADVQRLVDETVSEFGKLDVTFANAGIMEVIPFLEMTDAAWESVLSVNLRGVFLYDQIAARQMVAQGGGVIINTSSQLAECGASTAAAYSASKAAVKNLTKSAAVALAAHDIRVNAIQPGPIVSGMTGPMFQNPHIQAHYFQFLQNRHPGEVLDVANAALFLASKESQWMNGQSIVVDGGWLLNSIEGEPEYQAALADYSTKLVADWRARGRA